MGRSNCKILRESYNVVVIRTHREPLLGPIKQVKLWKRPKNHSIPH